MKPIVIETKLLTFFGLAGIVLYPFVFVYDKSKKKLMNHELIHFQQVKECGFFKFYYLYICFWYKTGSYYNIPFEKEAFLNEKDDSYLNRREYMAWKNYWY
jgi:cytochrome b subunit of formate dehydrogenase